MYLTNKSPKKTRFKTRFESRLFDAYSYTVYSFLMSTINT